MHLLSPSLICSVAIPLGRTWTDCARTILVSGPHPNRSDRTAGFGEEQNGRWSVEIGECMKITIIASLLKLKSVGFLHLVPAFTVVSVVNRDS